MVIKTYKRVVSIIIPELSLRTVRALLQHFIDKF